MLLNLLVESERCRVEAVHCLLDFACKAGAVPDIDGPILGIKDWLKEQMVIHCQIRDVLQRINAQ